MKRVVTGLSEIRGGGSYHRFERMVRALAENGFRVTVFSTSPGEIRHPNVIWRRVGWGKASFFKMMGFLLVFPFLVLGVSLKEGVRDVIVFGPVYAALLFPVKLCKRCRIYCMVRGMLSDEYKFQERNAMMQRGVLFLERVGFALSDRMIVVSRVLEEKVRATSRGSRDKIVYLPNEIPDLSEQSVDLPYGRRVWKEVGTGEEIKIFTGGVITAIKNYELILHGLSLLKGRGIPFHLCVAGSPASQPDRAYFDKLKVLVSELEMEPHVSWLGWLPRERLLGVLRCSDLYLGASHHEGMSNIFLEALALEVPCLAMKTPEALELLQAEGLLFSSPHELSEMVARFCLDKTYAGRIAALNRRTKETWTFNWEHRLTELFTSWE